MNTWRQRKNIVSTRPRDRAQEKQPQPRLDLRLPASRTGRNICNGGPGCDLYCIKSRIILKHQIYCQGSWQVPLPHETLWAENMLYSHQGPPMGSVTVLKTSQARKMTQYRIWVRGGRWWESKRSFSAGLGSSPRSLRTCSHQGSPGAPSWTSCRRWTLSCGVCSSL